MNPSTFLIRRSRFAAVTLLLIAALGLGSLWTIPRSEDPQFPVPGMTVRAVLPGATPAEMEQLVVRPLEDALYRIDDLDEVRATATDGVATINAGFDWGSDPDRKYDEVVREVMALRPSLPAGLRNLDVVRNRTTETAVFQIALVAPELPMRRLEKLAEGLREEIARVPGVRAAEYWGVPQSELRVAVDAARLAELRLPATAIAEALARAGDESPIGTVNAGGRRFVVRQQGAFTTAESVREVPVRTNGGAVLRVGDVASVDWATVETEHVTRFGGQRAIFLTATGRDGADIGAMTEGVRERLDTFERRLPGGVRLERAFFQAENVEHRLGTLTRDFLLALGIVCLTLLPLGLRAAGIVALSIPISLGLGLVIIHALGFNLNQLSIAGFVLSLGLLVDDSIVVVENIARHLRMGKDRIAAAIDGTGQITMAVLGCTACLMFAFLPLMALPEGSGAFIRSLPVTVLATVGASLVVALAIIPFAASRLLPRDTPHDGNALLRAVNRGIHRFYAPVLHRALDRPRRAMLILAALCLPIFPIVGVIGFSLFPPAETPQFLVRIELPEGASLPATDAVLRRVEERLRREPDVSWFAANLGRGNPQIYYNIRQHDPNPAFAEVAVAFDAWHGEQSQSAIAALRRDFARIAGARVSVMTFEQGPAVAAPIEIRISGPDLGTLQDLARSAELAMQAAPGIRDIGNPLRLDRLDLVLGLDEGAAATLGVPAGSAGSAVRLALSGQEAARIRDGDGDDYPVRVRFPMEARHPLEVLDGIFVTGADGAAVPLRAISAPRMETGFARIDREDRQRGVSLTAFVQPGYLTAEVTQAALDRVRAAIELPPGYTVALGGEAEEQAGSNSGMMTAAIIAGLGILAVLVLEFGRLRLVAVVAGIIPFGALGAVLALLVTGQSLSFTALIGLIALVGIEIKNSILLVDFTEQLRREGMSAREAVERAGELRFLPVLLTSVTAIGGLTPLALEGSGLYGPLAIAIIGGLIASTLLARVATPAMYLLLAPGARKAA